MLRDSHEKAPFHILGSAYGAPYGSPGYPPQPYGPPGYPAQPYGPPGYPQQPYGPGQPSYPSSPQPGGYNGPGSDSGDFTRSNFGDKSVRHAFIRKVYLILTTQLLVTLGFVCVFLLIPSVRTWVIRNSWFYYISYAVFFCTYMALVCCDSVRRRYPGNFIALSIFTLAFSYMTATISAFYKVDTVLIALGITTAVCLATSIFAIQTRIDITKCTILIFVLSLVLMLTGLACMIVYFVSGPNRIMYTVYAGIGALVFTVYLAFDTQMLIGGRKHEISPEEYIYAALQLYLDIVYLFLMILSLVGNKD
ncbi:unnamed protein product [Calicophoron daubneyi]|uniref:Uncharacterized protein n=1 Tax=Calicophoron daubneyi TaxID=300641 RepID=A0AAV2TW66_CALDB